MSAGRTRTLLAAATSASPRHLPFVPAHSPASDRQVERLAAFVRTSDRLLVLTGAGLSTESGVPDYRSEGVGLYARSDRRPLKHQVFMKSHEARKSYWARNYVGWPRWFALVPNQGHRTLCAWERAGKVGHVVTQNVDQLHFKAGSERVVELHGTNSLVKCTTCRYSITRQAFQNDLTNLNPTFGVAVTRESFVRPDGDIDLPQESIRGFVVPSCPRCQDSEDGKGILKPHIVFFGDNVPAERVERVRDLVKNDSDALLVVGSSLQVYSGYRIILQAKELGKKVAILNIGATRADHLADLSVQARAGEVLARIDRSDST